MSGHRNLPPDLCCVACQDCEALETETKRFEDLEFQQLERESRQDEEKETHTQQLLREIADYQRSTVTRKVVESRPSGSGLLSSGGIIVEKLKKNIF